MHMSFIVLKIRLKHISTLQWMLEKYNTDVICCCQGRVHSLGNTVLDSTDSYIAEWASHCNVLIPLKA